MINASIIEFQWSIQQALNSPISDIQALFESEEFKAKQEAEKAKFKALLKTIANTGIR